MHVSPTELAEALRRAELDRIGTSLLTSRFPSLAAADARAVARARDAMRDGDGDELIGYKLGWTSAAMRESLGIDRANWGTLWASQRIEHALDVNTMIHPKVEPEIVYVPAGDLRGVVDAATVIEACLGWCVGMEVVDPRYPSYRFTWLDNTADNSSAAGTCTGGLRSVPMIDPAHFEVVFGDGDEERRGTGAAAMGSPAEAVAWLVGELDREGLWLRAGQMVYTGGITAPFDVVAGTAYTVSSPQLGAVTMLAS